LAGKLPSIGMVKYGLCSFRYGQIRCIFVNGSGQP